MQLKAKDDDIYKLMDQKDLYLLGIGISSAGVGISLYLLFSSFFVWDFIYLSVALLTVTIFLIYRALHISRRIMEANQCYLRMESESLVVCQPENGKYESCRIYYSEMEKIVEGSRRGIPEFYIVIRNEEDRKSFILLDDEEEERLIFCVRSLGYDIQEFKEFYKKLKWEVPGKVRIIGTKSQETWELKQAHVGVCMAVAFVLAYLIPKIIEVMGLF